MPPILGLLYKHPDGTYQGTLRALFLRTSLELRPKPVVDGQRAYSIVAGPDFEAGEGRQPLEPTNAPIEMRLVSPELPSAIMAQAVWVSEDQWRVLWLNS